MIKLFLIYVLLLSVSCTSDWDRDFEGFTFSFTNNNKIENAKLYIGGIINGNFVKTDSIFFSEIKTGTIHTNTGYFVDDNRWKPHLERIRNIPSDSCYFKLKFKDREEILINSNSSGYFSLDISDSKEFFINDKGSVLINIMSNEITARVASE